jgi:hypothetical protein
VSGVRAERASSSSKVQVQSSMLHLSSREFSIEVDFKSTPKSTPPFFGGVELDVELLRLPTPNHSIWSR